MRYVLLLVLLLAACSPAAAQTSPRYQYATLLTIGLYGRIPSFEYGQHAKHGTPDPELEKLTQQLEDLDSGPLALTYLTSHGWELVNMGVSESSSSYRTLYLLRRLLP